MALNADGVSALLIAIHTGVVALTKNPVWEIDQKEADALAKATTNVARHYPMLQSTEKFADWAMLLQTLAATYGTRFYMHMQTKPKKQAPPAPAQQSNVAPFPGATVSAD